MCKGFKLWSKKLSNGLKVKLVLQRDHRKISCDTLSDHSTVEYISKVVPASISQSVDDIAPATKADYMSGHQSGQQLHKVPRYIR